MNVMQNANSLEEFWLPFTGNRAFKKDPRRLTRAAGMYFWDHRGERLIDGCSGLFCVALGHGRPEIAPCFLARVFALQDNPVVTDIRGYGLLAGIDLAPADDPGQRGYAALCALYRAGMVVRVTADSLILAPALVAERAEIDEICDKVADVLKAI